MKHTLAGTCAALSIFSGHTASLALFKKGQFKCGIKQDKLPRLSLYPKCG